MGNRYRKVHVKKKAFFFAVIIVMLMLISLGVNNFRAKYKDQESKVNAVQSEPFYFTSNCLSEKGSTITLASDTTDMKIELRNYADDLRYSTKKINYTYEVVKLDDNKTLATGSGTMNGGSENTSEISISGLQSGSKYKVTAISTSPFEAKLTGTFEVPEESTKVDYEVTDTAGSPYLLVKITTDKYRGDVTLSWPEKVIPDTTDTTFKAVTTWENKDYAAGSISLSLEPYSSYTYRFFKEDIEKTYDENSIEVETK